MNRRLTAACCWLMVMAALSAARGEEIQYVETFALAEDRAQALRQLIPGTEDYYYYHCLHYQNLQQFDRVDELLKAWIQRHQYTQRVRTILHRQALLTYDRNPQKSLDYLREQLGLRFDHQRADPRETPQLPTALEAQQISRETLLKQAFERFANLEGLEDAALEWIMEHELNNDRRRDFLRRLTRPDHEGLAALVVEDLKAGANFGDYPIHGQLLLEQLDECRRLLPALAGDSNFVNAYLTKLRPGPDEDWTTDPEQRGAYLGRLLAFVEELPSAFNSLKAHVIYHRLVHDRSQGIYNRELFLRYLALPRNVVYILPRYLEQRSQVEPLADLAASFAPAIPLPPVGSDDAIVRAYLEHFFIEATDYDLFAPYLKREYLREVFATTKLVHGQGDAQQWFSWLSPTTIQALKERVDLEFVPTNPEYFGPEDPVRLELFVKNVENLIVKVFEIQTANVYREKREEINTDIQLDGLTPNWEYTFDYDAAPILRVKREFDFPELTRRGVYVIDFIGNGKSSRALIRKGKLKFLSEPSSAGQIVKVLNENNEHLPEATVEIDGRRFTADDDGNILIPFGPQSGERQMILGHDGFFTRERFTLRTEDYRLEAGFYVDREQLLRGRVANVIVRPGLFLAGARVSLAVLEDVRMRVVSTEIDGVTSSYEVPDFTLRSDGESVFEIQVPPRLAKLDFTLSGRVEMLTKAGEKTDLAASDSFVINGIETSTHVEDVHLVPTRAGFFLEVLGRTGELRPHRPLAISLKHRDFREPVQVMLKSDEAGRITLGELPGIVSLTATTPGGVARSWQLPENRRSYEDAIHGRAGETIEIPYPETSEGEPGRGELSLLELRDGTFVVDRFDALRLSEGLLRIENLPAGNYDLLLKRLNRRIEIRVAPGPRWNDFVLSSPRILETREAHPVHVAELAADDEKVRIRIGNADAAARVHVLVTRYQPEFDVFAKLANVRDAGLSWWHYPRAASAFVEGRNIGDEYRYILERKYATKFPGNMLERPSLLLQPWPVRETETSTRLAEAGEAARPSEAPPESMAAEPGASADARVQAVGQATLDFLAQTSVALLNLVPDEQGEIVIPRSQLQDRQQVHVVLVHPRSVSYHELALEPQKLKKLDLRLHESLDVAKHFTQKKQVVLVPSGQQFVLADLGSARFETYDDLGDLYALLRTLTPDATLQEFQFLLEWHKLEQVKKQELYSKYACHELNYFLQRKDPAFFESVVLPYLRNKREKQFLDHWLLGAEVAQYQELSRYELLNTFERILLAQRVGDREIVARDLAHRLELIPPDVTQENLLFGRALAGKSLRAGANGAELGLPALHEEARQLHDSLSEGQQSFNAPVAAAPEPAGAAGFAGSDRERRARDSEFAKKLADQKQLGRRKEVEYFDDGGGLGARKRELDRFYQPLDKTREWAENHYYHVPLAQLRSELIPPSRFWLDYAQHDPSAAFYSSNFMEAGRNLHEALLAMAVTDLPPEAGKHESKFEEGRLTVTAASPLLAVFEAIEEASADSAEGTPILVSENFFRAAERYRTVAGQRQDQFVTGEFLVQEVYGAQIVITNPTSSAQQLDVLMQIPAGAIPLASARPTGSVRIQLEAFHTQTLEYYFYFPFTGVFPHYPAHVAREEKIVAFASPQTFNVVEELSEVDRESWDFVSQQGTADEVLRYLETRNIHAVPLDRIAWRLKDAGFFQQVIAVLNRRHVYEHTLWSYAVLHNRPEVIREFLLHAAGFVELVGPYLESPLLVIDPVERRTFEHLEYRPLVNARTHRLGETREILNDRFYEQYHQLMAILSHRPELSDSDRMAVVYYLLLQDRIAESLEQFAEVNPDALATRLQYDYFTAYLDFYTPPLDQAEEIAARYANYPVDRWREAFAAIARQVEEIRGGTSEPPDDPTRESRQGRLAASAPQLELRVDGQRVLLDYANVREVKVNFYEMDVELLFSSNPFVQQQAGQFSFIRPNATEMLTLDPAAPQSTIELPESLRNRNVLVEVTGAGITRTQPYYSHSLLVELSEQYGQLRVLAAQERMPLPKVYVKTYARMRDGTVLFFKDGYTDLRGRLDYATLSTNQLEQVERFAILILSDEHGALVREVAPPAGSTSVATPVPLP